MKSVNPLSLIGAINATEPETNGKPVPYLLAELNQIAKICTTEAPKFTARGLGQPFLNCAVPLANELEKRETVWTASRFVTPETRSAWKALSQKGYELRDSLQAELDLALMDNPSAQKTLDAIREGTGAEDMILDIAKLVELGREHLLEVTAAGITPLMLDAAADLDRQLTLAFASKEATPGGSAPLKIARDRARTFASDYLSLIRRYADVIYKNDPTIRALFASKYQSEKNRKYRETASAKNATPAS